MAYKCAADPQACLSWVGPNGVQQATSLFIDPASVTAEQVVATVGRVNRASFMPISLSSASTTLQLDIAGAWDKISFSNGACYLRTLANSTAMLPAPRTQSSCAVCTSLSPRVCTELVEGEWGRAPELFFPLMFSFAPSVKTFPVRVSLPAGNLGGSYLVSGYRALVTADLTPSPLTAPAGTLVELNPVLSASDVRCLGQ